MQQFILGESSAQIEQYTSLIDSVSLDTENISILNSRDLETALEKHTADIICVLYPLSWIDGLLVLSEIREINSDIPIILFGDSQYKERLTPVLASQNAQYISEGNRDELLELLENIPTTSIEEREAQHRESEEYSGSGLSDSAYKLLFELAEDAVFIMKNDIFIDCNAKTEQLFGRSSDQIIGRSPFEFSPPTQPDGRDSKEKAQEKIARALQGEPQRFEWRHQRSDGTSFETDVSLKSLGCGKGNLLQAIVRDITGRKKSEQQIMELSRYPEENPAPIFRFHRDGTVVYANPPGKKMLHKFSLKPGDVLPSSWMQSIQEYTRGEKNEPLEYEFQGKVFSFIFTTKPESGYITVYGHDITETKRSEIALKESEERYRAFVQTSSEGIFRLELDGQLPEGLSQAEQIDMFLNHGFVVEANDATVRMLGFRDIRDLLNTSVREIIERTNQEDIRVLQDFIGNNYRISDMEVQWEGIDGNTRILQSNIIGIRGSNESFRAWGTIRDITEEREKEEALRESEERFRLLAENIPGIVYLCNYDQHFTMLYLNDTFQDITGYPKEDFLNGDLHFSEIIHEEDLEAVYADIETAVREHEPYHLIYRVRHQSGEWRWLEEFGIGVFKDETLLFLEGFITDITQRRRAERAIRESEAKFRALTESTASLIFIYQDDRLQYVNTTGETLLGFSKEAMLGRKVWEFAHPDYRKMIRERALARQKGEDPPAQYEFKLLSCDGEEIWVDATLTRIEYRGRPAILGTAFDITERKRSEFIQSAIFQISEAAHTYQTLDQIYGSIHDIIRELMPAKNFYIALHNEQEETMEFPYFVDQYTEKAESRPVGTGITEYVLRTGQPLLATQDGLKKLIEHGEIIPFGRMPVDWLGVPLQTSDKTIGVLAVQSYDEGVRYTEAEKNILNFVSMQVAMTIVRKQTQAELVKERQQLAVTLQSVGDGVITTDTDGHIELVNRVGEELIGHTGQDASGQNLAGLFSAGNGAKKDLIERSVQEVVRTKQIVKLPPQTLLKSREGQKRVVAESIAPLKNDQQEVIGTVMVLRDETEKHRMEMELLKSRKLESVGTLAGGIAHDFNNILAGILGYISLARLSISNPAKIEELIQKTEKAVQRASNLTNQLLTFSKGGAPVKETASIKEVIEESAQFALHGSNVKGELTIADDLWLVEMDSGQMDQVLQNIIINADQAMASGGTVVLSARNTVVKENSQPLSIAPGNYVKITVQDHGGGIPEENIDKIFDPYFTTKQMGNGLGLATAYSIVNKHGGYIKADSQVGEGTTMTIYLPATGKQAHKDKFDEDDTMKVRGQKVLVMDDEETVLEVASEMLASLGCTVEKALDGSEAIAKYKSAYEQGKPFSLVIIDLTVPGGKGGVDTIRELRAFDNGVKVIVSSGYFNDPVMANFKDHGFDAKVAKPYNLEKLQQAISHIRARKSSA